MELRVILKCLRIEEPAEKYLKDVDFSSVSPAVHLVGAVPQRGKKSRMFEHLLQLIKPVRKFCKDWKRHVSYTFG